MPRYCANLKAIRYESAGLNRIVADKSHRVIVALDCIIFCTTTGRTFHIIREIMNKLVRSRFFVVLEFILQMSLENSLSLLKIREY